MLRLSRPPVSHALLAVCAILAAAGAAWGPALGGHFTTGWDDQWLLLGNRTVHGFSSHGVRDAFDPTIDRSGLGFEWLPVRDLSYMFDYEFWTLDPVGYRITSLLVHATASFAVYLLLARLLPGGGALLGAMVFVLHPLASEPVAWVSGRKDALAVAFGGASALALLAALDDERDRRGGAVRYLASVVLAVLALLSKSSAVGILSGFPLLVLLERPGRRRMASALPHVALAAAGAAVHFLVFRTGDVAEGGGPSPGRAATAGPAILHALRSVLVPTGLAPHHRDPDPQAILTVAVVGLVAAAGILSVRRLLRAEPGLRVARALAFGLPWVLVSMGPVLAPIPRRSAYLADRYGYPATIAVALLLATAWSASSRRPSVRWLLALPVLLALGAISHQRARLWRSEVQLWRDAVDEDPRAPVSRLNLAAAYFDLGFPEQAEAEYQACLDLEPDYVKALRGLAMIRTIQRKGDEARALLERAVEIDPLFVDARADLAGVLIDANELEDARREIQAGLAIEPEDPALWYYLGLLLDRERRPADARGALDRALELAPGDPRIARAREALEGR